MKAVLIVVVALMGANVQAASLMEASGRASTGCTTPTFTTYLVPNCNNNIKIKLPDYEDPTIYYSCLTGSPLPLQCNGTTGYFTYVLQECTSCADYIPPVACESLAINKNCLAISNSTTPAPTTVTTTSSSSSASTASTGATDSSSTASSATTASSSSSSSTATTSGTTSSVNGPPVEGEDSDSDVPAPPTPEPTAPVVTDPPEENSP